MKKLHFPIMIEIDEDGYFIVSCPTFKGCHSYGETIDEALENIKEAIELCMEEQENDNIALKIHLRASIKKLMGILGVSSRLAQSPPVMV